MLLRCAASFSNREQALCSLAASIHWKSRAKNAADLLFYHPKLRHCVVVELKDGGFKPEYAGKMMTRCCHPDEEIEAELGMRVVDSISNNSRAGVSVSLARSENCDLHGD